MKLTLEVNDVHAIRMNWAALDVLVGVLLYGTGTTRGTLTSINRRDGGIDYGKPGVYDVTVDDQFAGVVTLE